MLVFIIVVIILTASLVFFWKKKVPIAYEKKQIIDVATAGDNDHISVKEKTLICENEMYKFENEIINPDDYFLVAIEGESMKSEGIYQDDIAFVKRIDNDKDKLNIEKGRIIVLKKRIITQNTCDYKVRKSIGYVDYSTDIDKWMTDNGIIDIDDFKTSLDKSISQLKPNNDENFSFICSQTERDNKWHYSFHPYFLTIGTVEFIQHNAKFA
jgi:hypothetical protein